MFLAVSAQSAVAAPPASEAPTPAPERGVVKSFTLVFFLLLLVGRFLKEAVVLRSLRRTFGGALFSALFPVEIESKVEVLVKVDVEVVVE